MLSPAGMVASKILPRLEEARTGCEPLGCGEGLGELVVGASLEPTGNTRGNGGVAAMHSRVRDVMTGNVVSIPETAGYKDIVTMMEWRGVSAFPVVNAAGRVVGVVSEADLLLKEIGPESFAGPGGSVLASGRRGNVPRQPLRQRPS